MDKVCQQPKSISPRQLQPQTFKKDQKIYTPYRFEEIQTSQSYLLDPSPRQIRKPCKRVNSPGLPETSFRKSAKAGILEKIYMTLGQLNLSKEFRSTSPQDNKMPIGLVTDREQQVIEDSPQQVVKQEGYYVAKPFKMKSEESQYLHSFNPQQYQTLKEDKEIQTYEPKMEEIHEQNEYQDQPEPVLHVPTMERYQERPLCRNSLQRVEKLETDKLSLEIFMSERDENSLVFTGITKRKVQSSEENKKLILNHLQELFTRLPESDCKATNAYNNYIKMESLEQSMFQSKYHHHPQQSCFSEQDQISKHVTSEFMSVSSAQSIQVGQQKSKQEYTRKPAPSKRQQQLESKQPPWNKYSKNKKQDSSSQLSKQSISPFLKKNTRSNQTSQPKLRQVSQNTLHVRPSGTPIQSQKKIQQTRSVHSILQHKAVNSKIKSFHASPEHQENSVFDERFYQI